jgi:hypothetical protein
MTRNDTDQIERFKALARELKCGEGEATFEAALKKVAEPPASLPEHEPIKGIANGWHGRGHSCNPGHYIGDEIPQQGGRRRPLVEDDQELADDAAPA